MVSVLPVHHLCIFALVSSVNFEVIITLVLDTWVRAARAARLSLLWVDVGCHSGHAWISDGESDPPQLSLQLYCTSMTDLEHATCPAHYRCRAVTARVVNS